MISFEEELLTIPSDLSLINLDKDPFYRYKMPQIKLNYEKKTTLLKNIQKVAKALRTSPEYICEYFSVNLKTSYSKQVFKKRNEYKLKGFYQSEKIRKTLDKFIIEYLICKRCRYPQLQYRNEPNQIHGYCNSCGQIHIFKADQNKIVKFMYENPKKKTKQEYLEQEQNKIYGNRKLSFVSDQSQTDQIPVAP